MMRTSTAAPPRPAVTNLDDLVIDLESPAPHHEQPRLLFVASNAAHLNQLLGLYSWWASRDRIWVSLDQPDARSKLAGEQVAWADSPTTRGIPHLLRNLRLALRTMRDERPDVVVSTGAGIALPFVVVARLRGIPTVLVESYDRGSRTLAGRICRPLSSQSLVQWPGHPELYPDSTAIGAPARAW